MLQTKLHAHQKKYWYPHDSTWCWVSALVSPSRAGPRHLGEAASPTQGQQGWCGRCGCGWWVGSSRIEPRQKSAWNSCFTLQEHLSSRKWSTSMGDFLCQLRSPGRSTYVFIMFVHVYATFYPFWTMSRALPVWLKCQRRICPDFVE